jgi:RimJ/RimL family protein N-acetyltransferase
MPDSADAPVSPAGGTPGAGDLVTARLRLRRLTFDDADFVVELLNEPSFLRFIGDRGVRDRETACRYLENGPLASYARFGFGLLCVELKAEAAGSDAASGHGHRGRPIGICGLLKRDTLEDVDVGFAFLPRYWSQGYAFEAASAVLAQGREAFGLTRIVAITSLDNAASIRLLERLGFRFERVTRLTPDGDEVKLFGCVTAVTAGDEASGR